MRQWIHLLITLLCAPLLFGIINKTKAFFAGRKGPYLLQLYFDLFKLFHKSSLYSKTGAGFVAIGPLVVLGSTISSLLLLPAVGEKSLIAFSGDFIVLLYLLALGRVFMIFAAMDTGSSFEGMGSSREMSFALFVEPTLFLLLSTPLLLANSLSLSEAYTYLSAQSISNLDPSLLLVGTGLFIVLLTECGRIPIDDPNTHLELTMIHEAMILDHTSIDLACIFYESSLKLWVVGTLFIGLFFSFSTYSFPMQELFFLLAMTLFSVIIGIIESVLARIRLVKVFDLLIGAFALAIFALILQIMRKA